MDRTQKLKATFARCDDNTLINALRKADANHGLDSSEENRLVCMWVLQEVERRFPEHVRKADDAITATFEQDERDGTETEINYVDVLISYLTK